MNHISFQMLFKKDLQLSYLFCKKNSNFLDKQIQSISVKMINDKKTENKVIYFAEISKEIFDKNS